MKNPYTKYLIGLVITMMFAFAGWVVASNGKINDKIDSTNRTLINYNGRISATETSTANIEKDIEDIKSSQVRQEQYVQTMSLILNKYK